MTFKDTYIIERCKGIEILLQDATIWSSKNEKLGAHLAAYISVMIMGVLEDCIEHLILQRVGRTGDSEIQNYVRFVIDKRFRNPDHSIISGLLGEFSEDYQKKFKDEIPHDGKEASALQSIKDNKNSLAHLGAEKLQMTISDVDYYYRYILHILEIVEQILA